MASKHEKLDAHAKQLEEARTAQEAHATELAREAMATDREAFEGLVPGNHRDFEGREKRAEEAAQALVEEKAAVEARAEEASQRLTAVALREADVLRREEQASQRENELAVRVEVLDAHENKLNHKEATYKDCLAKANAKHKKKCEDLDKSFAD